MSTTAIIVLLVIVAVIVIGTLLKVNYGLLGIVAAFICGVFMVDMSASAIMNTWSVKLFFQMFSVAFFYAFAINNGTLELIAKKLVFATRKSAFLIPLILFVVCGVIAGIGPGTISTFLIMTPIVMQVAKESGMKPGLAAVALFCGTNSGGWSPLASNGITLRGIMESSGYAAELTVTYGSHLFRNMLVGSIIFFAIAYVIYRGWKCKAIEGGEAPAALNKQQKTTLVLIIVLTVLIVLPAVCKSLFGGPFFSAAAKKLDAVFLCIIFGVLAIILKVGDEKKALASVPWKTIIMVCGMGMLVSVAGEAGVMAYLSEYLGQSFSAGALPYIIGIVAAVMSLFSSTMGVVVPTLYPLVFAVCSVSGADPVILFSIIPLAATSAGCSPLSLSGGLVQATLEDDKARSRMFMELIVIAVVMTIASLILVALGIINT